MYRWTSWSPTVFYTQLLRAIIACMSDESGQSILVWKAFLVGRLPAILASFEKEVVVEGVTKSAMHAAVVSLKQSPAVTACDVHLAGHDLPGDTDTTGTPSSLLRDFVREAVANTLLDKSAALSIDHHLTMEPNTPLRAEIKDSQEGKTNVEAYMFSKLENMSLDDLELWAGRLWREPALHRAFADALVTRFASATSAQSPEADQLDLMSRLCEICCLQDVLLDIFALHKRVSELVAQAALFVEDYDVETVGDPQTAYGHLGKVILFIQETTARFHVSVPVKTGACRLLALVV
ncbi:hypothetical protein HDZ31DRAFT_70525 [Schizophyllum fasciatum]